jgi:CRISPR/Cas system-associated exonuclease Cas4 (RecB family)
LHEKSSINFKTDWFKFVGKVFDLVEFEENKEIQIDDDKIAEARNLVQQIEDGEVVELKKYKLAKDNPLVIKNKLNKLESDPKFATTVLKDCDDKESELCQKAYFAFLKYASFDEIKKLDFPPTKDMFRVLMERYLDEDDKFDIPISAIEEMLMQFKATRDDYLELAYEIKAKLSPDALIALFEKLYNSPDHEEAADAYLYVLYELKMIDKIREILENSDEKEFMKFKALLFLRDHGQNVNSSLFLRDIKI